MTTNRAELPSPDTAPVVAVHAKNRYSAPNKIAQPRSPHRRVARWASRTAALLIEHKGSLQYTVDRYTRITRLDRILSGRRVPVPLRDIRSELDNCSRATAVRAIETLRDDLGAPVQYNRQLNGYHYTGDAIYQLPGLWLNASELMALVVTDKLLGEVEPGVIAPVLKPLRTRIHNLLAHQQLGTQELLKRLRVFQTDTRPTNVNTFRTVAEALAARHKIRILYHGRERDKTTERTLSPQRLTYYRNNWYLDAWCHTRHAMRTFSIDRVQPIETLNDTARDVADDQLDAHYQTSYGIYAGRADKTAVLRFTAAQANWVADEQWHPDQHSQVHPDGTYELHIPYADPRELIMQIMKYGADVEVIAPAKLREAVIERANQTLAQYK